MLTIRARIDYFLLTCASLEHQIRKKLKKKPHQHPTARWVFQCFQGVGIIFIENQATMVVNLKERQQVTIDCLGEN